MEEMASRCGGYLGICLLRRRGHPKRDGSSCLVLGVVLTISRLKKAGLFSGLEGSCEHGNGLSSSIKCLGVFEWLHNWRPLKKDSTPWS